MSSLINRLKTLCLRLKNFLLPNVSLTWKLHLLKDFWGTKIWTKTSEVTTPLGFKLVSGFHPAYELMRAGKFEIEETAIIKKFLAQVDVFVDVGANLGYFTCLALQSGKQVIAFEPQQQNLQCLFNNIMINQWETKAEVMPIALSSEPGLLNLYGASGPSASLIKNWAGYSSNFKKIVPVSTLDNILAGRFLNQKLFIKIDVEGAEFSVLKGALATIKLLPKPIWLIEVCLQEFHPEGKNPDFEQIFQLFWESNYVAYTATTEMKIVTPDEVKKWVKNSHSQSGTFNYVFAESGKILSN